MYCLHPCIQKDSVIFTAAQALWRVPVRGGRPERLTDRLPGLAWPHQSPDGQTIAFVWNGDVHLMASDGGDLQRLTYLQAPMTLLGWREDSTLLLSTSARQPFRQAQAYTLSLDTGDLEPLSYGACDGLSFGPQSAPSHHRSVVLQRYGYGYASWKRYQGGTAGELWVDSTGEGSFIRLLPEIKHNILSPMWIQDRIYFVSDFRGQGQLHSCRPDGQDLMTHPGPHSFYVRQPSTDGNSVIATSGGALWHFDPATSAWTPVEVTSTKGWGAHSSTHTSGASGLGTSGSGAGGLLRPPVRSPKDPSKFVTSYDIAPKGKRLAVATRGRLFSLTPAKGPAVQLGTRDGVRYRWTTWLHDHTLVAVCDQGGKEMWVTYAQNSLNPDSLQESKVDLPDTLNYGRITSVQANPTKRMVAFTNHRHELFWLDLEAQKLAMVDTSPTGPFAGYDWSPCGRWIAYSKASHKRGHSLWIYDTTQRSQTCVQDDTFANTHPTFDPQGKALFFLSARTFDPQWDGHHVTMACEPGDQPFVLMLTKTGQSPFVTPLLDGLEPDNAQSSHPDAGDAPGQEDKSLTQPNFLDAGLGTWPQFGPEPQLKGQGPREQSDQPSEGVQPSCQSSEQADAKALEGSAQNASKPENVVTTIDFDGIDKRVLAFPLPARPYSSLVAIQGGVLYTVGEDKSASLYTYRFETLKEELLISALDSWAVSVDKTWTAYRHGRRLRTLPTGTKADDQPDSGGFHKGGDLDWSRLHLTVDPHQEWVHMFDEAWRLQRDMFWTPQMGQINWDSVYARYRPLLDHIQSKSELYDVIAEMQGELGTSHAYIYPSSEERTPKPPSTLGADFVYDAAAGTYRITHMLTHDAWQHIPLCRPGLEIEIGDLVWSVAGQHLSPRVRPEELIQGQEGSAVPLVVSKPDGSNQRTVVVFPAPGRQDKTWRYRQWVETNRQYVTTSSEGQAGYVHLPDMVSEGFGEFLRGYLREYDKAGLIIDARYNAGGNISYLILDFLRRHRLGYDQSRHQGIFPYPSDGPRGPMVALINEATGSDGDIFAHAFGALGLGPLIGKRTWGGVVGIWPRYSLIDGTMTTQPEYSFWFHDAGWTVENKGVDPTIEVDLTPQDAMKGQDPQLERGLLELKRLIALDKDRQTALQTQPPLPVLAAPGSGTV